MSDNVLKPTAEWALGRPARSMRYLAEPMARAIWAEQERDEAEARAEAAEQQAARLRAALRDFESNGIRADCNPTVPLEGCDTAWWYAYIANADLRVRERARAALAAAAPAAEAREPRGEGDRFCLDCQTPLRTRVVARCYECVERHMLSSENYQQGAGER